MGEQQRTIFGDDKRVASLEAEVKVLKADVSALTERLWKVEGHVLAAAKALGDSEKPVAEG